MKAGDLVVITRASIGVPAGTLALCMDWDHMSLASKRLGTKIWFVQLLNGKQRRYLEGDLEIFSASR